jgi:DNA-binding response OmpR family regulator
MVFLNRIVQSFESQAKLKNIKLSFSSHQKSLPAFIDREKLENIFYNLLSNAFKFTRDGGKIMVRATGPEANTDNFIHISVSDTGMGIPADKLEHIFDRFYQVDDSYTKEQEGSGIGLALTRELVELHHGKIEVTSKPGVGTTFTVFILAGKDHLKPDEIVETTDLALAVEIEKTIGPPLIQKSLTPKSFPIILTVEDNSDMRAYLKECLQADYQLREAADGKAGMEQALKYIPDLIISDVMMPYMDGFTFCGKIKTDERTSHIPVILLTARADAESKIAGLETGADDYLSKPFDARELKVRVKNLIEQRRKLRERFSREVNLKPLDMAFNTTDEKFLQRLMELIEDNMTNPEFRVETFVKEMGMSRAQLYRKLHALCGQSVKAFVRIVRLKHAARLLQQPTTTIAEVAYRVGFNNPAYFSECFRKQFGLLPSQYENEAKH